MGNISIKVHLSEEDLWELQEGKTFDWTFKSSTGEDVDIHLYRGEEEDE